jgi:taurine transport system permease protein
MNELPEATTSVDHEAAPWYFEQSRLYEGTPRSATILNWRFGHKSISLMTIALMLCLWQATTSFRLIAPLFLPSPTAVTLSFVQVWHEGFVDATLFQHIEASLGRILVALVLAICVAIPVGLAAGVSVKARAIIDPFVEFLRPIPPLAYLPLIIIWCGIGEAAKILVLWLAICPAILIAAAAGVKTTSPERIDAARSLGASHAQVLRHVVFPSALPSILSGIRIGLAGGWSTLVAAELIAATRGLGFMIQSAAQFLVTDVVVMGIFVIAAIAVAFEGVVRLIERLLVPWHGKM